MTPGAVDANAVLPVGHASLRLELLEAAISKILFGKKISEQNFSAKWSQNVLERRCTYLGMARSSKLLCANRHFDP